LNIMVARLSPGAVSESSSSHLPPSVASKTAKPVTFPLALLSLLGAETGVSTAKNASPIKGTDQKSRRSEDQVAFHLA